MNRDSIIGFILIAGIMIGYTYWMAPSEEELARKQFVADSTAQAQKVVEAAKFVETEKIVQEEQPVENITPDTPETYDELKSKYDLFANAATGTEKIYTLENDLVKIEISNKGGYIKTVELKDYQTFDSLPVILFNPETSKFGLSFFSNNRIINTQDFYFIPDDYSSDFMSVTGSDSLTFSMKLYAGSKKGVINKNQYIEFLYKLSGDNYMFDFDINVVGMDKVISSNSSFVDLNWYADLIQQEKTVDRFNGSTVYYKYYRDDVDYLNETKDDESQIPTKVKWVSFKQRFFSSTLIAKSAFNNANLKVFEEKDPGSDRYLNQCRPILSCQLILKVTPTFRCHFILVPISFTH